MGEILEYLGTIAKPCASTPLGGTRTYWQAGETVIIRELDDTHYRTIMKLENREISMIAGMNAFKYYQIEWLKVR